MAENVGDEGSSACVYPSRPLTNSGGSNVIERVEQPEANEDGVGTPVIESDGNGSLGGSRSDNVDLDNNDRNDDDDTDKKDSATDATAESVTDEVKQQDTSQQKSSTPVVSSSKKTRPPYRFDPNKITLRFLFANRDGLTVTIECEPSDTVGEVKGALLSVWPEDLPNCSGGDRLRLVCMGKGYLMPDTRTLEDCQIPVFKTHPTPVNVSVSTDVHAVEEDIKKTKSTEDAVAGVRVSQSGAGTTQVSQGCGCVIL